GGARRAEAVGRMVAVAISQRHATKQHLVGRQIKEFADDAMEARPRFLRARVEPVAARQIHERVDVAAEIGPLAGAEPAVDGDEQPDRPPKELEIALVLGEPAGMVVARDPERAVELHAMLLASRAVGLPWLLRVDRVLGLVVAGVARC